MRQGNVDEKEKASTAVPPGEVAWIVVETGSRKGEEFYIDKPQVSIGRHSENDICLAGDEVISRFHGRISFCKDEGAYYYEDLNSTNGTRIHNNHFKNEKVKIKHGDRIIIGKATQLRFFTKKTGLKDWLLG